MRERVVPRPRSRVSVERLQGVGPHFLSRRPRGDLPRRSSVIRGSRPTRAEIDPKTRHLGRGDSRPAYLLSSEIKGVSCEERQTETLVFLVRGLSYNFRGLLGRPLGT